MDTLRKPIDTLWTPRGFNDKFPTREKHEKGQEPRPYGPAWRGPNQLGTNAQSSWDQWSHNAEEWLLDLA
eukprot:9168463-Heterocapsa_arctica.AAC.1